VALNLPLNTLGFIITYNVLNLGNLSYTGFWSLATNSGGLTTINGGSNMADPTWGIPPSFYE